MTAKKVYERIGRTLMEIHSRQHTGDARPLTISADLDYPPSTPEEVADLLDRLLSASIATQQTDTIQVRVRPAKR